MNRLIFSFTAAIIIAVMAAVYSDNVSDELSGAVVRLHILANSSSPQDQAVKLAVRDDIINGVRDGSITTLADAERSAVRTLAQKGMTYDARAEYGKYFFPTKDYKNISMPAGEYRAVRVILGSGRGENWWCVMYPPLCFTEECRGNMSETGIQRVRESLHDESADIITGSGAQIEMRFKVVEVVQEVKRRVTAG